MADIYVAATAFTNPPGAKQARLLREHWPQIEGFTSSPDGPIWVNGSKQPAGYVIHTTNNPEPDEQAIIADAIALSDGTTDPPLFGVELPMVATPQDLPGQPPDIPNTVGVLAVVRNPPSLWVYALGAWRGPIEPT